MGIDVIDFVRAYTGACKGKFYRVDYAFAVRLRYCNIVAVARLSPAEHARINFGSALNGAFLLFENGNDSAARADKAVPMLVERPRRRLRVRIQA